ncbi:prepilin-type N-terminal cleavage/methylation domain-containing protein [Pontiellaceae bacterium B12219]|nr:prepilin-type N-terminal cleavage/methylation domain-containing protein [Pontiellaceae bacterium B12219]
MVSATPSKQAFTLTEVMVALFIGMMAMAGFLTVFISFLSSSEAATVWRDADNNASVAIDRMVRGTEETMGLRQFHLADTNVTYSNDDWTITDERVNKGFTYSATDQTISDLAGNVFISNVDSSTATPTTGNLLELSISIISGTGKYKSSREFNTTIQPRNP